MSVTTNDRPKIEKVEVLRVVFKRGKGVFPDPYREVTAYYDLDGNLLWEHDPQVDVDENAVDTESDTLQAGGTH